MQPFAQMKTSVLALALAAFVAGPAVAEEKTLAPKTETKTETKSVTPERPAPSKTETKADSGPAPKLVIEESTKDLGVVPQGTKIKHTFKVKNTGKGELKIESVNPSCGCTVANFDKVIKPGGEGKIETEVDTKGMNSAISKSVTVTSNDPDSPQTMLFVKAIVKPLVEVLPTADARFSFIRGEEPPGQSLIVTSEERPDFKVEKVVAEQPWIKATVREATKDEQRGERKGKQWKVDVAVGKDAPIGPLAGKVIVHTNLEKQPTTEIRVGGVVRPLLTVTPKEINFATVNASEKPVRAINVINNGPSTDFKVTKVETTVPGATADLKVDEAGKRYQVELKLGDKVAKGPLAGDVKIYTNAKDNEVQTVKVSGTVE